MKYEVGDTVEFHPSPFEGPFKVGMIYKITRSKIIIETLDGIKITVNSMIFKNFGNIGDDIEKISEENPELFI